MNLVNDIIRDAFDMARHPVLAALEKATRITAPKADARLDPFLRRKRGMRLKLSRSEAEAAAAWVTHACEAHGLATVDVLRGAGVATSENNFGPFRLTAEEFESLKAGIGGIDPGRRICLKIAPYYSIAREIRRRLEAQGGGDRSDVPASLGLVLDDYLRAFRDQEEHEDLAERLAAMGPYFERTFRMDGVEANLPETAAFAHREDLSYSEGDGTYFGRDVGEPTLWETDFGTRPRIPLAFRKLGWGTMTAVRDGEELGAVRVRLAEVVGIILVPEGPDVRVALYGEPVTIVRGEPGDAQIFMGGKLRFVRGGPWRSSAVPGTEWAVVPKGNIELDQRCVDYIEHHDGICDEEAGATAGLSPIDLLDCPRIIELSGNALLSLSDLRDDDVRMSSRFTGDRAPIHREPALPAWADRVGGGEGDPGFLPRLKQALEDLSILDALKDEVTRRAKAMEAHLDAADERAARGRKAFYDAIRAH